MDFPDPLKKLWSAWEIRVFVICSLILQICLIFLAAFRKRKSSKWASPLVWAFYLLADWVAAFALGLLCDSQGSNSDCENITNKIKRSSSSSINMSNATDSRELLAFWAPFLLLHLGGPDTITAFALEDNELWLRHLLGLIFEVLAALYVFLRSFPMKKLLIPTLLMFLAGIIKYGERTRALYLSSMDGFRDSMLKDPDPGPNYAKFMGEFTSKKVAGVPASIKIINELENLSKEPKAAEEGSDQSQKLTNMEMVQEAYRFFMIFKGLISNLIFSFQQKEESKTFFLKRSAEDAFKVVEIELSFIYELLYTKAAVVHSHTGHVLRCISSCSICASLLIFVFTNKHGFKEFDVVITYALLVGAVGLDVIAFVMFLFSDRTFVSLGNTRLRSIVSTIVDTWFFNRSRWSASISQYNLIDFCLRRRWKLVKWTTERLGVRELLDHFQYRSHKSVNGDLKDFIFVELKRKSEIAKDSKTTKMLCSCRGSWALEQRGYQNELGWSVEVEFDESLLLWHIATDICYYKDEDDIKERKLSKFLSDYMLYLLVVQPSMMSSMAGIGQIRYRDTCAEAMNFFPKEKSKTDWKRACDMLFSVNTEVDPAHVKGDRSKSVLFNAVILAKQLDKLGGRKWSIISEVWADLLSYAATHCRGNSHAARLSKGGELLMFVWFLMAQLGLGEQFCIEAGDARAKLIVEK